MGTSYLYSIFILLLCVYLIRLECLVFFKFEMIKIYKIKNLLTIVLLLGFVYSNNFYFIPTQNIEYGSDLSIGLQKYSTSNYLDIKYQSNDSFNIRASNDSIYITPKNNIGGLSALSMNINGEDINLIVYISHDSLKNISKKESIIIKDSYEFSSDDLILSFKNVTHILSNSDLRDGDIKILFNNTLFEKKYYHIFKDKIRVMMPKSFTDGMLRICATDKDGNLLRENQTLFSNGMPVSTNSLTHALYFSNIYYLMVDRFSDKNKANNLQVSDLSIDNKLKFHGGDLSGIIRKLNNGYFDRLGINNILISPIQSNPDSASRESQLPFKKKMGFDGSWPIDSRSIDPRFGTDGNFRLLVNTSHKKDIGVFMEFIAGHTHQDHPYYQTNSDWYNFNNLNSSDLFLPVLDLSNKDLIKKITLDAAYWIEEFNINGLFMNVNHSLSYEFAKHYNESLKSENSKNIFQSIKFSDSFDMTPEFVHPLAFNSEMNFDLYLQAREHFSKDGSDFIEFNQFIENHLEINSSINLMGTFTGIDNEPRFISVADGQAQYNDNLSIDLSDIPDKIINPISYEKLFMFTVMNNSLPGIPMIYYGEEYGQVGGAGFDSKRDMKFQNELSILESYLKDRVSKLNLLRKEYPSLSIGDLMVLRESKHFTAWLKSYYNEKILILFNLQDKIIEKNISLPFESNELHSLKDDSVIILDDTGMASFVIPPYKTGIYLLKTK